MKNKVKVLCSLILIFSIFISSFNAYAATNYNELFDQIITCDEAKAEALSISLGNAFNENAEAFINEASQLTDTNLDKVCLLLVSNFVYTDLDKFIKPLIS